MNKMCCSKASLGLRGSTMGGIPQPQTKILMNGMSLDFHGCTLAQCPVGRKPAPAQRPYMGNERKWFLIFCTKSQWKINPPIARHGDT